MRVPKHFDPRQPASRRNLSAAFRSKLAEIDLTQPRYSPSAMDEEVAGRIADLRPAAEIISDMWTGCRDALAAATARLSE